MSTLSLDKPRVAPIAATNRHSSKSKRIMIVDDETDIVFVVAAGFRKSGFAIHTYTDPQQALNDFKPNSFDVLIVDVRMPVINGFEFYQKIRKVDPSVPVVFFTAFETSYTVYEKTIAGLDPNAYFVKKPITSSGLIDLVNKIISDRKIGEKLSN